MQKIKTLIGALTSMIEGYTKDKIGVSKNISGAIDKIEFPNVTIKVNNADNDSITFKVWYKGLKVEDHEVSRSYSDEIQAKLVSMVKKTENNVFDEWDNLLESLTCGQY